MNQVECLSVAANFLLVPILHDTIAENDRTNPVSIHLNAFNAIG